MMACHFSFNLIDSIWVGRLIGPAALASVSTAGFYIWVALSLGEMVEIGLIAVAARRHGEGHPERAARVAAAAVVYALLAGMGVSIVGWSVAGAMFRVMKVPPEVATLGHAYLSTWLLGAPLVFGFFAIEATFRASGDTRTPFLMLAGSVGVSITLDPLLIAGVGPFPRLGVEGAALASVMVRGGGFLLGLVIALRRGLVRSRRRIGGRSRRSYASARHCRWRACSCRSSICGSRGSRRGSVRRRSRPWAWAIRWKGSVLSRSAALRSRPAHSSARISAHGRKHGRGRPYG